MLIPGNSIINDCIYRAWLPGDCQETLKNLQAEIDSGGIQAKITYGIASVLAAGKKAGGADPMDSFQVYILPYMSFWNEEATGCDEMTWGYPWSSKPKLTRDLRKQLNGFARAVNDVIKAAVKDLEYQGAIMVEDMNNAYDGHRFCEDRHKDNQMTEYLTQFWSPYSNIFDTGEGLGDPSYPDIPWPEPPSRDPAQILLDFIFPGKNYTVESATEASPPWAWEGHEKYSTYDDLMVDIQKRYGELKNDANPHAVDVIPFEIRRSFHPKATGQGWYKTAIFKAIAENRDIQITKMGTKLTERCKDVSVSIPRIDLIGSNTFTVEHPG